MPTRSKGLARRLAWFAALYAASALACAAALVVIRLVLPG